MSSIQSLTGTLRPSAGFERELGADFDGGGGGESLPDDGGPQEPHRPAPAPAVDAAGGGARRHRGGRPGCQAAGHPELTLPPITPPSSLLLREGLAVRCWNVWIRCCGPQTFKGGRVRRLVSEVYQKWICLGFPYDSWLSADCCSDHECGDVPAKQ